MDRTDLPDRTSRHLGSFVPPFFSIVQSSNDPGNRKTAHQRDRSSVACEVLFTRGNVILLGKRYTAYRLCASRERRYSAILRFDDPPCTIWWLLDRNRCREHASRCCCLFHFFSFEYSVSMCFAQHNRVACCFIGDFNSLFVVVHNCYIFYRCIYS